MIVLVLTGGGQVSKYDVKEGRKGFSGVSHSPPSAFTLRSGVDF